jgi:hypothetical protein
MNFFAPLLKADAAQRLVWGTIAAEQPDKSNEIMDYATAKPEFEKWSADIAKATGGKSLGNVRLMHKKDAVGKVVEMIYDDLAKRIDVCVKVVDDAAWKMIEEGVLSGFSIGGGYLKKWADKTNAALKRYTPVLSEVSLVDNPCLGSAKFSLIKADGVEEEIEVKADGHLAKEAAAEEVTDLETRLAAALAKSEALKAPVAEISNPGAGKLMIAIDEALRKAAEGDEAKLARITLFSDFDRAAPFAKAVAAARLKKGFYTVSRLADQLSCFSNMVSSVIWEEKEEGGGSMLPQASVDVFSRMKQLLIDMISEESAEFITQVKASAGDAIELFFPGQPDDVASPPVMELAAQVRDLEKADSEGFLKKMGARPAPAAETPAPTVDEITLAEVGRLRKAVVGATEGLDRLTAEFEKVTADYARVSSELTAIKAAPAAPKGVITFTKDVEMAGGPLVEAPRAEAAPLVLGKVDFPSDPVERQAMARKVLAAAGYAPGSGR